MDFEPTYEGEVNKEPLGSVVVFHEGLHHGKPEAKPKATSTARKAIILAKGTISLLANLSVFVCLALLLLTYKNQQDVMQQLQRSQMTGAANPSLASAPLSYITVGGCTQVQLTLSQYSGGFIIQACWGSYCGEPAIGNCQPQVMQQAIANFESTNPSCLFATTTTSPAPATSNPVPTTSSQSNYFITIGGCTQVSVFQWSGSGHYYVTLSWNGYLWDAYGETSEAALQEAIANFEAKNPPCLAGTTYSQGSSTSFVPPTSSSKSTTGPAPVPTTSSQSTYFITIGGCTQVTVYLHSYSGHTRVSLVWNDYRASADEATPEAALQVATATFEAQNPPCLAKSTTGPAPVPTTSSQSTYFITIGGCTQVTVYLHSGSGHNVVHLVWNDYRTSADEATPEAALQVATATFEAQNPPCLSVTTQPA